MKTKVDALLQQMLEFVDTEQQLEEGRLENQWRLPLKRRLEQGNAIDEVWINSVLPKGNLKLEFKNNFSKFREGDNIVLHKKHPKLDPSFITVILDEQNTSMIVKPIFNFENNIISNHAKSTWIIDEAIADLTPYYRYALERKLPGTKVGREIILPLLAEELGSKDNFSRWDHADQEMRNYQINTSQLEAITKAYASEPFYLVQGPPGTGKTYVLAHIARLCVRNGLSVMVTGLSHRGINNALNKIHDLDPNLPIAKIGEKYHSSDLAARNFESYGNLPRLLGDGIVGCTPFEALSTEMDKVVFDIVLVDEASQVTLPLAVMAMLSGKRYVFIGDENQLPPVTLSELKIGKISIFEYLKEREHNTVLTTTYRMNRDLCNWPSKTFYDGDLKPDNTIAQKKLDIDVSSLHGPLKYVLDPENPLIFIDMDDEEARNKNPLETSLLSYLVKALYELGIPFTSMGVVTPFRAQARAIKKRLREMFPKVSPYILSQLAVDTVERMQGQERDVIFVSLVTTDLTYAEKLAEFYFEPRRLNVTVTRAKFKLIVLGYSGITRARPEQVIHQLWVDILDDFISQTKKINYSDFSSEVYVDNIS